MAEANIFNPFAEVEEEFVDETNAVRNRNRRRMIPMNNWTDEWDLARKNNFVTDVNALFRTLGLRNRLELQEMENHLNGIFRLRKLVVNNNEDQDQNNEYQDWNNNSPEQNANENVGLEQNVEQNANDNGGLEQNVEQNANDNGGPEQNLNDNDGPQANPNILQAQKIALENQFYTMKGRVTKARKRFLLLGRETHDSIMAAQLILKFFKVLPDVNHRFSLPQEIHELRNQVAKSVGTTDLNFSEEAIRNIILRAGHRFQPQLEIAAENEFLFLRIPPQPSGLNVSPAAAQFQRLVDLRVNMDQLRNQIEGILEEAQHQNVHLV